MAEKNIGVLTMALSLDNVKDILIKSRTILSTNLRPEDELLLKLITTKAITPDQVGIIKSEITDLAKTEKLLDILSKSPVTSYEALMTWLEEKRSDLYTEVKAIQNKICEGTGKPSQGSNVTASIAERTVSLAVQSATPAIYMGQSRVTNVDNRQYHYGQQATQHPASHTGTKVDGSQHLNISAADGSHWQIHPNKKPCIIPNQSKVKDPDSSDSSDDDDDIQVADLPQGEQAIPPMHYNKLILEVFIDPMTKNDKLFKKAKRLCRHDWATQNGLSFRKLKRLKPFKFVKRLERCQLLSPINQEFLLELMKNLEQKESVRKIEKFMDFHKDDILVNRAPIRKAVNGKVYTEIVKEGDIKQLLVNDVNRYRKVLNQQLGVPPSAVNFVGSGSNSVVLVFLLPRQWSTVDNEGNRCIVNIVEKLQEAVRNRADWLLAEDIIGIHIEGQPYVDLKKYGIKVHTIAPRIPSRKTGSRFIASPSQGYRRVLKEGIPLHLSASAPHAPTLATATSSGSASGRQMISQEDIRLITHRAGLEKDDFDHFYAVLGISETDVEKSIYRADTEDIKLQSSGVLNDWRIKKGSALTRSVIIRALRDIKLTLAAEYMENEWGITTQ